MAFNVQGFSLDVCFVHSGLCHSLSVPQPLFYFFLFSLSLSYLLLKNPHTIDFGIGLVCTLISAEAFLITLKIGL